MTNFIYFAITNILRYLQLLTSRHRRLSQFLVLLNIPRHHHHHSGGSSNTSQQHSPQTPHSSSSMANTACQLTVTGSNSSGGNSHNNSSTSINTSSSHTNLKHLAVVGSSLSDEEYRPHSSSIYLPRSSCVSFQSEILLLDLINCEINEFLERYC